MKTIRNNVFETNSSSVHCVTILSDKEYQNIESGKAVINGNRYFEPNLESVEDFIKYEIVFYENMIKNSREDIKKYKILLGKDTGDWSRDEKWNIAWNYEKYNGSELKKLVEERIQNYENKIKEYKESIKKSESLDTKKFFSYVENIILPNLETIICPEEEDTPECLKDVDEKYVELLLKYSAGFDNIDTFGEEYECDEDTRTIEGITVHVLSYFGYDN